ncbi:D-alanyl-D-alanine carboxypeptidase [Candidatus Nomurabacteria bacterium]|nr:D-alanyl-D-alanine carboxypeptidase [Candidatus Nomurabacteria bacterium]
MSLNLIAAPLNFAPVLSLQEQNVNLTKQELSSSSKAPQKNNFDSWGVKITAESAAILDLASGAILWQKNAEEVRSLASITKLMTTLVFLEHNPGWNKSVTMQISDEVGGAAPNILRGETVTVKDLFYAGLIASDNNAINALVRSTGIAKNDFIKLMNQKAESLGLKNTHFEDLTGLTDQNHSTALEILQLAKIALENKDIQAATEKRIYNFNDFSGRAHKIFSTNKLLDSYLDIIAGKTGFINSAGYCLVSEARSKDGHKIIGVVLGSKTHEDRFQDLKILLAWTLNNFNW